MEYYIEIFGVLYAVHEHKDGSFTLPNFLGSDSLEDLKRSNPYHEASGYSGTNLLDIYEHQIRVSMLCPNLDALADCMLDVYNGYQSVGWECLTQ